MVKMVKHTKLKNLLEKPWNPPEVTRICDPSKSKARRHHSFKLGSKLKYLSSDQLPLSKRSKLGYFKSAPTNIRWVKARWINDKYNNVFKTKRKETIHMLFFTTSNFKSAKTCKSRRVLLSRKTVYSGISKLIL